MMRAREGFWLAKAFGLALAVAVATMVACSTMALAAEPAGAVEGAGIQKAAAQVSAKYKIKTADYKLTVPKYWRGKVCWQTTKRSVYQSTKKYCTTTFYLKGHKGDSSYIVCLVSAGDANGPGPGLDMTGIAVTSKSKAGKKVYVTARNWPLICWTNHDSPDNKIFQDVTKKQFNKMSKIVTGGKVTYKKALASKKNPDYKGWGNPKTSKYRDTAKKYLKTKFKDLKVR